MPAPVVDRVPAPALFVASGLTQYLGAAVAIGLFTRVPPATVAWLRLVVGALVLLAWRRPWRRRWGRRELAAAAAFGVALGAMNVTFYLAIADLPLGTAVAIEFIGPVAVAALTGSGWRERVGIALAAAGVVTLAGVTLGLGPDGSATGLVWILAAAGCWAAYIVLGRRVAVRGDGVTTLGLAMAAGAVVLAPLVGAGAAPVLRAPDLALAVVAVALLSSVVPYGLEQVVLRRVSAATFAVLLATLPAAATVIGAVVLRQWPHPLDLVGLALVSGAIALTSRRAPEGAPVQAADGTALAAGPDGPGPAEPDPGDGGPSGPQRY